MSVSIWISSLCTHQPRSPMSIRLKYLFPPTCAIDFSVFVQNTHLDLKDWDLFVLFCHRDVTFSPRATNLTLFLGLTFPSYLVFLQQISDRGSHDLPGESGALEGQGFLFQRPQRTWPVVSQRNIPAGTHTQYGFISLEVRSNARLHLLLRALISHQKLHEQRRDGGQDGRGSLIDLAAQEWII